MARLEKIPVIPDRLLTYQGYYDIEQMQAAMRELFEDLRNYDMTMKEFNEKVQDGERDIFIKDDAELQFNDYYRLLIRREISGVGKDVLVESGGKKRLITDGTVKMKIKSWIIPDYLGRRNKGALGEFLGKLYDNVFGKEDLEECKDVGIQDIAALERVFKQQTNSKLT